MADILLDLPVKAPLDRVFQAVSTPHGLDCWWTKRSTGKPVEGAEYEFWFGPQYHWRAKVTRCVPSSEFEIEILCADTDWNHTRVGFMLEERGAVTWVQFYNRDWPGINEHFRISSNCWAMYLRLLRRYLENGEVVPYENRLYA